MAVKRGDAAKLYYSPAEVMATSETPTDISDWTLVNLVRDVTLDNAKDEIDVTSRDSNGIEEMIDGIRKHGISFEILWDETDTTFQKLLDAYNGNSQVCMAAMDGPIATTGSEGFAANMGVFNFTRNEPVTGPMTATVSVKPTYPHLAQWYVKAA